MRILQASEAAGGGLLGVVATLADGLVERGHEVGFAYGRRPETPSSLDETIHGAVETFELPWGRRTAGSHYAGGRALRRLVAEWQPDVVHLHSSFTGVIGTLALGRRVPTIYSPHAYAFAGGDRGRLVRSLYRSIEWVTARRCDVIGAVSESEAELARDALHAPRIVTVPNGISELDPWSMATPRPDRRRVVVGMGRITAQQRPQESARILAALAESAEVRWIGCAPDGSSGPMEAAGVPVTGWLDRHLACDILASAQVYVHWSGWDGQSLSVLEAMARDVIVIASDIPANREIVGPGAVCSDPESAITLARAALDDPGIAAAMLAEQQRRRGRWAANRMIESWQYVYEHVVAAPDSLPVLTSPYEPEARRMDVQWS
jgi:glycosyltransferase involved in cell wall biosynthesis